MLIEFAQLLLSVPQSIRTELEKQAIDAIREAADMFSHHAAPPNSGCGMQAKFLHNLLRVFRKAQDQRHGSRTQATQPVSVSQQPPEQQKRANASSGDAEITDGVSRAVQAQHSEYEDAYAIHDSTMQDCGLPSYDCSSGSYDFAFADDEIWATVFADAGFSINDGIFLPYSNEELESMGPLP